MKPEAAKHHNLTLITWTRRHIAPAKERCRKVTPTGDGTEYSINKIDIMNTAGRTNNISKIAIRYTENMKSIYTNMI